MDSSFSMDKARIHYQTREVLPRIVKDAHMVVHRHKVNDETQAESAKPNRETFCRLR